MFIGRWRNCAATARPIDAQNVPVPILPSNMLAGLASLPAPPLPARILFESQVAAPLGAAAVGLVLVAALARQGKTTAARIALAVAAVGIVALALSNWTVTTPREQLEARTLALVDAVAINDAATVEDMLSKRLVLRVNSNEAEIRDPRALVLAEMGNVQQAIESHNAKAVASITDTAISGRVRFSVRASIKGGGINFTVWLTEWRKDPDGVWRLYGLDWKKLNGQPPFRRNLFGARPPG